MITLEQIEDLMNRTGADYPTVRDALLATDGDMYQALQIIESKQTKSGFSDDKNEEPASKGQKDPTAQDLLNSLRDVLGKANATSIIIRKVDKDILNLSVTAGAIGLILAPIAAVIGIGAAVVKDYEIIIELEDGRLLNLNDMTRDQLNDVKAGWETYTTRKHERREQQEARSSEDATTQAEDAAAESDEEPWDHEA